MIDGSIHLYKGSGERFSLLMERGTDRERNAVHISNRDRDRIAVQNMIRDRERIAVHKILERGHDW